MALVEASGSVRMGCNYGPCLRNRRLPAERSKSFPRRPEIMVGTSKGLFKSIDGGNSWVKINSYENLKVFAVAFDEDNQLFGSVETFGIVGSSDLGDSWDALGNVSLTVTSIAPDSQNNTIYLAGYSPDGYQEVYKFSYDLKESELIGTNQEID